MSSAASSAKTVHYGGSHVKGGHKILPCELADLSSVTHNGSAHSVQPETGTGCWNWWEIANARIVGEACDRWFARYLKRSGDRLVDAKAYYKARHDRDLRIAVAMREAAARAKQTEETTGEVQQ